MKVVVVSAHFNPGHISHLEAFYSLLSEGGYDVSLLIDRPYLDFLDGSHYNISVYANDADISHAEIVIIYAMSVHDVKVIRRFRRIGPCRVLTVVHEPWCGWRYWYHKLIQGNANLRMCLNYFAAHMYSISILRHSDAVLLPSPRAVSVYRKNEAKYNQQIYLFPLIFTDETKKLSGERLQRKYFSFVANASNVKGFPLFIQFIKEYLKVDKNFYVKIITRTDITDYLDNTLLAFIEDGRLFVMHGKSHTDEEINSVLMESKCTWLVYPRSTQSGVMARSFMCGCPVLASDLEGFREYVDGKNGVICESKKLEDIYAAYQKIDTSVEMMSRAARESFSQFYYKKHITEMSNIICDVNLQGAVS